MGLHLGSDHMQWEPSKDVSRSNASTIIATINPYMDGCEHFLVSALRIGAYAHYVPPSPTAPITGWFQPPDIELLAVRAGKTRQVRCGLCPTAKDGRASGKSFLQSGFSGKEGCPCATQGGISVRYIRITLGRRGTSSVLLIRSKGCGRQRLPCIVPSTDRIFPFSWLS